MCGLIHQNSKATVILPLRSGSAIDDGNIPTTYLPICFFFLAHGYESRTPLSPVHRPAVIQHQNREVSIYPDCRDLHCMHGLLCFAALSSAYSRRGLYPQDKYIHSTRQLHSKASSKELQRDIRISPVLKPQGSTPSGALKGLRKPNLKVPSPDGPLSDGAEKGFAASSPVPNFRSVTTRIGMAGFATFSFPQEQVRQISRARAG